MCRLPGSTLAGHCGEGAPAYFRFMAGPCAWVRNHRHNALLTATVSWPDPTILLAPRIRVA